MTKTAEKPYPLGPHIPAGLKERMHNRDTLKIKAVKSNDPHDWANFKRMRNKVNTEIKGEWKAITQFLKSRSYQST